MYDQTREFVSTHRFGRAEDEPGTDVGPAGADAEK
jgi:hypothetical protein